MKHTLYIEEPLLRGRLHIAYPMISFMQHPMGKAFLYNYFLNLECHRYHKDLNLCYMSQYEKDNTSWIHYLNEYHSYHNFFNGRKDNIIETLVAEIANENYISLFFDDYFLPNKMETEVHFIHINFIFGYDKAQEVLYTYGYDNKRKLRTIELPFSAAINGITSLDVETYKPDFNKCFEFNKDHFWIQINDFLASENNMVSTRSLDLDGIDKNEYMYGISVYERIFQYLEDIETFGCDIRNLYMLNEWSKLNYLRVKYLQENKIYRITNDLIQEAAYILQKAKKAHLLMLKYTCSGDKRILPVMKDIVKKHRDDNLKFYFKLKKIAE